MFLIILGLHPQFWLSAPQTFGISLAIRAMLFCYNIWSRSQSLKTLQSHKGEIGILLLFITSPFSPHPGYVREVIFGKHLRMGAGCQE